MSMVHDNLITDTSKSSVDTSQASSESADSKMHPDVRMDLKFILDENLSQNMHPMYTACEPISRLKG